MDAADIANGDGCIHLEVIKLTDLINIIHRKKEKENFHWNTPCAPSASH